MGELRRKAGVAKRRLINAQAELFPKPAADANKPFAREYGPKEYGAEAALATEAIHSRLTDDDLAAIATKAESDTTLVDFPVPPGAPPKQIPLNQPWRESTGVDRKRNDLMLGTRFAEPTFLEKTGLTTATPPEEIHAMTHSPFGAGGGFYQADLVADGLASAGAPIADGDRILDFGCSSGRVARVLHAAYPNAQILGCDPNGPAIEWADGHLAGIEFTKSENEPPLPYEDGSIAAAFGISIWSHYAEALALRWYDEIHRVLRPGGHLVSTTHGPQSIDFYGDIGLRSNQQLADIRESLYLRGYWYAPEFGDKGDWGVVNSEWGTSFVSADWMLDNLTPKWEIVEYATARNEDNQDVYVLRKPLS